MLLENNDLESVLLFLRQHGCPIVDSIRMVVELRSVNLDEAKSLVHYSETWNDVRLRNEEVQAALLKAFEDPHGQVA